MSETIELKATVTKKLFYNEETMFGGFAFEPKEDVGLVKLHETWKTFVVTGNVQELFEGKEYDIEIEHSYHPRYGKGYSFVNVRVDKPTSVNEQQAYIRALLTEKQAEGIIAKYPNHKILDLMKSDEFDYSDIHGIGKVKYEQIKTYLLTNLDIQEALVELQDLNITFKAMKRLIDYFGTPQVVVQKVRDNIYTLMSADGFSFKRVDEYAMRRGDDKKNPNRIKAAIEHVLSKDSSEGNSWMTVDKLNNDLYELLQIDYEYISDQVEKLRKDSKEVYFQENKVALYKNWWHEKEIKKHLFNLLESDREFNTGDIEAKIKEVEDDQGFEFSNEQRESIKMAVDNNVFILNGKAGAGKTTALSGILKVLDKYKYQCCALSGKAANVMSEKGLHASTIHRLLGVNPKYGFEYNSENTLPYDIIVLDEASMCSSYMFYSVVSAISKGSKFIILGDSGQLAPIGTGAVFEDILRSNTLPQLELTKVQRQAEKSGILSTANQIRDGHQVTGRYNYGKQVYGELKDFVTFPMSNKEHIKDVVLEISQSFKNKDVSEFQVITGLKERGDISVKNLNIELQNVLNEYNGETVKRKGYDYKVGDKIIQCGNNYNAGERENVEVFNGTLGKIVDLKKANNDDKDSKDQLHIKFEGIGEVICYEGEDIGQIELAYAISCHRSQGSTIPYVLFVFDYGSYMLLSKQFVYTGITRASKGCVMVAENRALHHAIRTDHGGMRNTWLKDMLVSEDE